jgi:Flp pilus assembly protein TadD
LDEATAQYREAVRVDPSLVDAQIDLGTALLENGDFAGAKEHLQTASKLDPKLAQPHNYLGKIFMREGNTASAIAQFEEALRLHPDFPEAEENLRMAKASDGGSLTLSPR